MTDVSSLSIVFIWLRACLSGEGRGQPQPVPEPALASFDDVSPVSLVSKRLKIHPLYDNDNEIVSLQN